MVFQSRLNLCGHIRSNVWYLAGSMETFLVAIWEKHTKTTETFNNVHWMAFALVPPENFFAFYRSMFFKSAFQVIWLSGLGCKVHQSKTLDRKSGWNSMCWLVIRFTLNQNFWGLFVKILPCTNFLKWFYLQAIAPKFYGPFRWINLRITNRPEKANYCVPIFCF